MAKRNPSFWRRVIEYQVLHGDTVNAALSKAKFDFPYEEQSTSAMYAHKKIKQFDLQLYRSKLYEVIQKSAHLIKKAAA